ncbi:MAG: FTR1 family iron permease, partial [Synergistaceae bacterium]|nr:FTR1 family iron permease [Synergistaceae bacterium]
MLCALVFATTTESEAARKKKKYNDWRGVAADIALEFNAAIDDVKADNYKDAYTHVNDAYFKYYEVQGVESTVMYAISAARVNHIEAHFRDIKHVLLGNQQKDKDLLLQQIEALKIKVYKDSMVLDGMAEIEDPDSVGLAIYTDTQVPKPELASAQNQPEAPAQSETPSVSAAPSEKKAPVNRDWLTFVTAFGLLVREGLEAILVIAAIVAYLIKTGNKHMLKGVYLGSLAAVLASVVLAWALEAMLGEQSGVARELLEGWTMFLAVAVLFYVSNWMLSKADTIAWENYISGKVQQSIDSKSQWTLIFAAFIAVMREGAELILFYSAAFTGGMSDPAYIAYGIGAGVVVLVVVWVCFRYFSVRLPLRAFFMFTSVLLFLMCISFMG